MKMKEDLKKLSARWELQGDFQPTNKDAWIEKHSSRIGVRPGDLEKAFEGEFSSRHDLSEELEIPDVLRITYKYSYGGQSPFFRALRDYGRLLGTRCESCDFTYCPPRKNCSRCYEEASWVELPGTGKVETFTTIYKGPMLAGKPRVICAYIRLDESDFVMMANVQMPEHQDASHAHVGLKVRAVMNEERSGMVTDFHFVPEPDRK
jgi:uncharacterized OB-fold protein